MISNFPPFSFFREHRQFQDWAGSWCACPEPEGGPLDYLLPESRWQELLAAAPDPAAWLMACPSYRGLFLPLPGMAVPPPALPQTLEDHPAPGGRRRPGLPHRGPGPALPVGGINFLAVDKGEGEFQSGLPVYPKVERGDIFAASTTFAQAVLYAWPPPGQIPGVDLPARFSALSYSGGGGPGRGHRGPAGTGRPCATGIGGLEPLRPGPHRCGLASGHRLLRQGFDHRQVIVFLATFSKNFITHKSAGWRENLWALQA